MIAEQSNGTAQAVAPDVTAAPAYPHDDRWVLDMNGIKRGEIKVFRVEFRNASKRANETKARLEADPNADIEIEDNDEWIFKWAVKIIKKWPHDLDPSDVESFNQLGLKDYKEAMGRFMDAFREVVEGD